MISASGNKKRLNMKYPKKLCPLRPATRAGQNAIATQIRAKTIQPNVDTARTDISLPYTGGEAASNTEHSSETHEEHHPDRVKGGRAVTL
jgi:hypothetical protein